LSDTVLFGRPRKLTPHQRREAIARRDAGDETAMGPRALAAFTGTRND
jgi:hypothetical protein